MMRMKQLSKGGILAGVGAVLLPTCSVGSFSLASVYMTQAAEGTGSTVGGVSLALSIATAGSIVAALLLARALRFMDHRVMIGIAALCVFLFHFAIARATSVAPIYVAAVFEGIGVTWGGIAMSQIVIAWRFERTRGRVMSLILVVMAASLAALFPVVARYVAEVGYRPAVLAVGVIVAIGMGVCALLTGRPLAVQGQSGDAAAVRRIMRSPVFLLLCLICCLAMIVSQGLCSQTMVLFRSFGIGDTNASYVASIFSLVGLPWSFLFGLTCDKLSPGKALSIFGGICAAALLLSPLWHGFSGAVIFAVGFSAGGGAGVLYSSNMAMRLFGAGSAGDIMGRLSVWSGVGSTIGPALFGLMYDATGGYLTVLIAMGVVMVCCIALNAPTGRICRIGLVKSDT